MNTLQLVTIVKAKVENRDLVKQEILKLIPTIRKEKGCQYYNFFEDSKDNSRFILKESWANKDDLQAHIKSPHLANYTEATKGAVEIWDIIELTPIDEVN
ncbi:MAG: hypothetical protein BEN18_00985 [Epulopiscium sp. Nuni2H_MBin001]|nr:MAG: hypothetical protein BEN18_00985 [Epulopiscium sp. Nuni2H_MBin001]